MQSLTSRTFRFGICLNAQTAEQAREFARRAEAHGYDVMLSSDHLDLGGAHFARLSPLLALAVAAQATTTLRLGTAVLNQDLRHPAVLAREVASLDLLCEGRFELGIGAGWAEYEYRWAGIPFDPAATRIRRLREYVRVVKGILEQPIFSFAGEFFQITEMPGEPAPVQSPRPPLLIGGSGRRLLATAAAEADIVGINVIGADDPDAAMDERIHWLGERQGAVELNMMVAGTLLGGVEEIIEQLLERRARWGVSYILDAGDLDTFAPVVARLRGR